MNRVNSRFLSAVCIDIDNYIVYNVLVLVYALKGVKNMKISYKKLWKLLIDRDMLKKDLAERAGISSASISKLAKNENVNTDILLKVCSALECDISDIMEISQEN